MPSTKIKAYQVPRQRPRRQRPSRVDRLFAVPRLPGSIAGPPNHLDVRLRYIGTRSINLVASLLDSSFWALNGLYDPDTSGVGGQPLYFDQYMAMYSTYVVTRVDVECRLAGTMSAASAFQPKFGIVPLAAGIPVSWPADFVTPMSRPGAKHTFVMANRTLPVLKHSYAIGSIFGVPTARLLCDVLYHGSASINPAAVASLNVLVQNNDAGTTFTCSLEVGLTYHVRFYGPLNVNAS